MTPGYHAPLYRLALLGLVATAVLLIGLIAVHDNSREHDARPASSTIARRAPLVIDEPVPGAHVTDPSITVRGHAEPGSTIVVLGSTTTTAADGSWSLTAELPVGVTALEVKVLVDGAVDTTSTMTVTREAPSTSTTAPPVRRRTTTTAATPTSSTPTTQPTTVTADGPSTTTSTAASTTTTSTTVEATTTTTVDGPSSTTTTGG